MRGNIRNAKVLQWSILALTLSGGILNAQALPVKSSTKSSPQLQGETLPMNVDKALEITRKELLAGLKKAKHFRVANRKQDAELEKERFGWPGQKLNFDHAKLDTLCKRVATALFRQQHRVTALPSPTAWVKRDGPERVAQQLDAIYPQCRSEDRLGRDMELKTDNLQPETRVYAGKDATLVIVPQTIKIYHSVRMQLYVGNDTCPVYELWDSITLPPRKREMTALAQIDGQPALIRRNYGHWLGDEEYWASLNRVVIDDAIKQLFDVYPTDWPIAAPIKDREEMLVVYMPPYSPRTPPIAQKNDDWEPFDSKPEEENSPHQSRSSTASCFIYFR